MTSYNREKYIAEAIESVLASTYKNFELLVVDDGSKDNTVGIAKKYAQNDSRVKVYVNENNVGDYPNRNKAASYATGKYIKYVDSDDTIYPWGLEILVTQMEANPTAGYGLCSLPQDEEKPYPILLSPAEAYMYNYSSRGIFQKAPLSAIIRRDVFEKENGFLPQRMSSDFEMWHRLSLKHDVLLMCDGVVWSRAHAGREMADARDYMDTYEKITVKYLTHPECPLPADKVKHVLSILKKRLQRDTLKNFIALRFKNCFDNIKRLKIYKRVTV